MRSVGIGVSEIRLDVGPGYRVYFTRRGDVLILLLCGGDKTSQQRDIKLAQQLAGAIEWPLN
ncbi:type II toxin-antitoxin system RelE/ParE family toxin [Pseudomonas nitroreducens]|uniref:type II toxin-antitoxin system RelE/ParE family toxin n=1 Tax=Pseudomonas nitroreducens TaxID=46680 RepID=UPI0030B8C4CE